MSDFISREAAIKLFNFAVLDCLGMEPTIRAGDIIKALESIPAADVRPVVLCGVCELHGHCYTEDVFAFARLAEENRFCAVGKVKTNGKKREES